MAEDSYRPSIIHPLSRGAAKPPDDEADVDVVVTVDKIRKSD